MSIRIGNQIISGIKKDTISNQNSSSQITQLYNWVGTTEEYYQQEIATLHPDWVCYIIDGTEIAPSHRVIEFQKPTAENNYTWYRLYDDGWVEQGGTTEGTSTITVNLPITMLDENYFILTQSYQAPGYYSSWTVYAQSVTDSQFILQTDYTGNSKVIWEVKGLYYQEEESGELLI